MKNLLRSLIVAMALGGAVIPVRLIGQTVFVNGGSIQRPITDLSGASISDASAAIMTPGIATRPPLTARASTVCVR